MQHEGMSQKQLGKASISLQAQFAAVGGWFGGGPSCSAIARFCALAAGTQDLIRWHRFEHAIVVPRQNSAARDLDASAGLAHLLTPRAQLVRLCTATFSCALPAVANHF